MRITSCVLARNVRGILAALLLAVGQSPGRADPSVLLQGFWWNFWNNNHPGSWADYLAHLAPRLRDLGIEAIWIPPTSKNQNALHSVGYAPFDHYDLGDKWQGGSTRTRFGTKDEYLRAVAVLQANGIAVIQDVVLNHLSGAGAGNGAGGSDPTAPGDSFKNFRYACWVTPANAATAADYLARRGRFPKNAPNFHPNPDHDSATGNVTTQLFGPDVCYYRLARGPSGNATFNPAQGLDYMRNGTRAWMIWLKKQTGVDGFRLDAVKHFETWAAKDFVWNAAYNAGFASGGPGMFCVGEYVGGAAELDAWVDQVNNSDGFTDVVGTFDFGLRGALKAMIDAPGTYDLGSLPAAQQQRRSRTVPFLNSHDTFRPILDSSGRYTGWNTADEIGGHIDPAHPRLPAAYAVALALDGSPCVFFEDLFDLHSTGRRFTHRPSDPVTLPVRDHLRNLLWCHRHLRFKEGAGRVRWQAPDLLAIERSGRAVILASDRPAQWQSVTVQTAFPAGTRLRDHGGSTATEVLVDASGRATLRVPPTDGSARRRGYAVWGPAQVTEQPPPAPLPTRQEWELADDLGDSHPSSLRQGGALPAGSTVPRTAGRIHAGLGRTVSLRLEPTVAGVPVRMWIEDRTGQVLAEATGSGVFTLGFTPGESGWLTLRVANGAASNPAQGVRLRAIYTAPRDLLAPAALTMADVQVEATGDFSFRVDGPEEVRARIEVSEDLEQWRVLPTLPVPGTFRTRPGPREEYFRLRPTP